MDLCVSVNRRSRLLCSDLQMHVPRVFAPESSNLYSHAFHKLNPIISQHTVGGKKKTAARLETVLLQSQDGEKQRAKTMK